MCRRSQRWTIVLLIWSLCLLGSCSGDRPDAGACLLYQQNSFSCTLSVQESGMQYTYSLQSGGSGKARTYRTVSPDFLEQVTYTLAPDGTAMMTAGTQSIVVQLGTGGGIGRMDTMLFCRDAADMTLVETADHIVANCSDGSEMTFDGETGLPVMLRYEADTGSVTVVITDAVLGT